MSQGAISLSADGRVLLVVNPASGDLTAFRVTSTGLKFGSKVSSGGAFPVSVTCNGDVVYVLNQLGTANICGFTVSDSCRLTAGVSNALGFIQKSSCTGLICIAWNGAHRT